MSVPYMNIGLGCPFGNGNDEQLDLPSILLWILAAADVKQSHRQISSVYSLNPHKKKIITIALVTLGLVNGVLVNG